MKNLETAIEKIKEGGKFNGVVYQKNNGKNWCMLFIYVSNEFISLGSVWQSEASLEKANVLKLINEGLSTSEPKENKEFVIVPVAKNEWIVNDKKVVNNLNYGQMWDLYGTDFE